MFFIKALFKSFDYIYFLNNSLLYNLQSFNRAFIRVIIPDCRSFICLSFWFCESFICLGPSAVGLSTFGPTHLSAFQSVGILSIVLLLCPCWFFIQAFVLSVYSLLNLRLNWAFRLSDKRLYLSQLSFCISNQY